MSMDLRYCSIPRHIDVRRKIVTATELLKRQTMSYQIFTSSKSLLISQDISYRACPSAVEPIPDMLVFEKKQ